MNPSLLHLLGTIGLAFLLQHKVSPALNLDEGSIGERLFSCSFCTGFWAGFVPALLWLRQEALLEGGALAFGWGLATGAGYFYAETWASRAEVQRLEAEEHIGLIRRNKALADKDLEDSA